MKPLRISLFILSVFILLSLLAWLIPEDGIAVGGEHRLRFFKLSNLVDSGNQEAEELSRQLLASSDINTDPESDKGLDLLAEVKGSAAPASGKSLTPEPKGQAPSDGETSAGPKPAATSSKSAATSPKSTATSPKSAAASQNHTNISQGPAETTEARKPRIAQANSDSLKAAIFPIGFPREGRDMLQPFFRNLDAMAAGNKKVPTRVLHFGDSQIENDRMTALIRYRLQKHFGGAGVGLIQAIPLYSGSMSYKQVEQGNWLRYTYFGRRDTTIKHKSYGIMGAFSSVPAIEDTIWPSLTYRFNQARRSGWTDRARVFMHSYVDSAAIAVEIDGEFRDTIYSLDAGFNVADYRYTQNIKKLKLSFAFPEGGRIYGISFEHSEGMQMDNIAMRGSSGLIFTQMNTEVEAAMLEQIDPGLIILQFGGNVVPYMTPSYYGRHFARQLALFKRLCPGVPILVIGPGDMSMKHNGRFVSYPNLSSINKHLENAALSQGCGFWNLFEAMGGANSMPTFVHSDPPLASSDHIHFSPLGINLVAEMFYNALMMEYRTYKQLQP